MRQSNRILLQFTMVFIVLLLIGRVNLCSAAGPKEDMVNAKKLIDLGKYSEALAIYDNVIKTQVLDEYTGEALFRKGEIFLEQGKVKEAVQVWKTLVEKYPVNEWIDDALEQIGVAYAGPLNNRTEAIKTFRQLLKEQRYSKIQDRAQFYIAFLYYVDKKYNEATSELKNLIRDYPKSPFIPRANEMIAEMKGG